MTAGALLEQVRSGQVSATELVKSCLDKLHRVNELTDAVIAFNDERALSEAAELDAAFAAGAETGPLHGLPITVKDWIDAAGFPCAGATGEFDRWPTADATVVSRLREAGAVIVAKSRPSGSGPQVRHPLDSKLHPGGSSSGEAVLLAAGASPLGIGSDSGGSIRLPAAWCGVWGLKPTAGLVPVTGHFPACGSLSDGRTQIGPMAGSVLDLEIALRVIAGPDFRDAGAVPVELGTTDDAQLSGRRYAIITAEGSWSAAPDTTAAVEAISTQLAEAGLIRVEWSMPWLGPAMDISLRYWNRGDLTGEQVEQHLEDWDSFRNSYLQAAEQIDFIISPVAAGTAPAVRQLNREDYVFTLPASLTGSPALALPGGADGDGRPIGVQIMGRPWEDHAVLALGRLLESMRPVVTPEPSRGRNLGGAVGGASRPTG